MFVGNKQTSPNMFIALCCAYSAISSSNLYKHEMYLIRQYRTLHLHVSFLNFGLASMSVKMIRNVNSCLFDIISVAHVCMGMVRKCLFVSKYIQKRFGEMHWSFI